MQASDFLTKVSKLRNQIIVINKELEELVKVGKTIPMDAYSFDFDGDEGEDIYDNLGDALEESCELELVASSLYHYLAQFQNK